MFSLVSPGVHPGAVLLPAPVRAPGDDPRQQPDPGPRHQVPVLNGQRAPGVALTCQTVKLHLSVVDNQIKEN